MNSFEQHTEKQKQNNNVHTWWFRCALHEFQHAYLCHHLFGNDDFFFQFNSYIYIYIDSML